MDDGHDEYQDDDDYLDDYDNDFQDFENNTTQTMPIMLHQRSQQQTQQNNIITTSFADIFSLSIAHDLMSHMVQALGSPRGWTNRRIRQRVQLACSNLARHKHVIVTVEEEDWSCVITGVAQLLNEWMSRGRVPSTPGCVQIMAFEVQWQFDPYFDDEDCDQQSSLAQTLMIQNNDSQNLPNQNVSGQNNGCIEITDIRSITSRPHAIQILQDLANYLSPQTGPLTTPVEDSYFRQLAQHYFSNDHNIFIPETVWPGLISMMQELRFRLGWNEVAGNLDNWMRELSKTVRWQVELTDAERYAHRPNCSCRSCPGLDKPGVSMNGEKAAPVAHTGDNAFFGGQVGVGGLFNGREAVVWHRHLFSSVGT
ncbi:hypothetical protein N0V94_003159 [Neodidymelliopsis sp. IMI 364377]|nr:hypothetical protein N0V94_003159 [Neodidymelliopsis sp. IMI 364377]